MTSKCPNAFFHVGLFTRL